MKQSIHTYVFLRLSYMEISDMQYFLKCYGIAAKVIETYLHTYVKHQVHTITKIYLCK